MLLFECSGSLTVAFRTNANAITIASSIRSEQQDFICFMYLPTSSTDLFRIITFSREMPTLLEITGREIESGTRDVIGKRKWRYIRRGAIEHCD